MDITALTVDQLKVLAYDQVAAINASQRNLQAVENELARRAQSQDPPVPAEKQDSPKKGSV